MATRLSTQQNTPGLYRAATASTTSIHCRAGTTLSAVFVANATLACKPASDAIWFKSLAEDFRKLFMVFIGELAGLHRQAHAD